MQVQSQSLSTSHTTVIIIQLAALHLDAASSPPQQPPQAWTLQSVQNCTCE